MIRHTILYLLVRAGNGVFALATLAVFTRLLTPDAYGKYAIALASATIASSVLFQWLNVAIGRFYPFYRDDPAPLMEAADRAYLATVGICALIFMLLFPFHETLGVDPELIAIVFLMTLALGRYNMSLQVSNARLTPILYGALSWTKTGGTLIAGSVLIVYGAAGNGALFGVLISLVVAVLAFGAMPRLWRGVAKRRDPRDPSLPHQMRRYGLPLTVAFFTIVIVDLSDRVMIGWLLGASQVGPYAAAYDLTQQTIGVVMNAFFLAAFPAAVHASENEGDAAVAERLRSLGLSIVTVGLPFATGFALLSPEISAIVFGEAFQRESAMVMPWIAAAIFVGAYKSYYLDTVFQLHRVTRYQAGIGLAMASANIALNFVLLPPYGVLGAVWATLAALSLGSVMSYCYGKRFLRLPRMMSDFTKAAIASAAMLLVLLMPPPLPAILALAVKAIAAGLVFAAAAYAIDLRGSRTWLNRQFGLNCGLAK